MQCTLSKLVVVLDQIQNQFESQALEAAVAHYEADVQPEVQAWDSMWDWVVVRTELMLTQNQYRLRLKQRCALLHAGSPVHVAPMSFSDRHWMQTRTLGE